MRKRTTTAMIRIRTIIAAECNAVVGARLHPRGMMC
jgi:hypothetical protein